MSATMTEQQIPKVEQPPSRPVATYEAGPITMTPLEMVRIRMAQCVDMEQLSQLMDMEKRWHDEMAERAYVKAFAAFKQDMPPVFKDLINKQYDSEYSSLGNLVNNANIYLGKHDLHARWDYVDGSPAKGTVCIIKHIDGHSERVWVTGPLDNTGQKNELQKIKSTSTYLMGITFSAVTGIVAQAACLDDDGTAAGIKKKLKETTKPQGWDKWEADAKAVADSGSKALGRHWESATDEIRGYCKSYHEAWFSQLRRDASKVTKKAKEEGVELQ